MGATPYKECAMYQLQIWGPKGQRVLRWDPRKLQERDPLTLAAFAEAEQLMKEALMQNNSARQPSQQSVPHIAAAGRWIE
jgi:hypothetical protein